MLKLKKLKPETTIASMGCADSKEKIIMETTINTEEDIIILKDINNKIEELKEEDIKNNIDKYSNGEYMCKLNDLWVKFLGI